MQKQGFELMTLNFRSRTFAESHKSPTNIVEKYSLKPSLEGKTGLFKSGLFTRHVNANPPRES